LTTTWAPVWTREEFPAGRDAVAMLPLTVCRTCGCTELRPPGDRDDGPPPAFTRSTEPHPAGGGYLVQPHHLWCPAWTGAAPMLPCPACGGPVHGIDSERGYRLIVPDPNRPGRIIHLVGTAGELLAHPHTMLSDTTNRQRLPERDKVTVSPCGDILLGAPAHQVLTAVAALRRQHFTTEAAKTIAESQPLLDAAHRNGRGALADEYITAVRTHAGTTRGLLRALQILDGAASS
jgi:hypothetical protein